MMLMVGLAMSAAVQAQTGTEPAGAAKPENAPAAAQPKGIAPVSESVTVYGWRNGNSAPLELGTETITDPASVSVITQEDVKAQIATTPGDVLRGTTGVQVADYGQPGEAQGITMRGWSNGYDGGFVSFTQDGFQRNQPSNISVNGYLDINPLIPETVDQITVVRGPSDVRYGGNYAQAGSIVVKTRDYIPSVVDVTGGSFGTARVVGVYGYQNGATTYYTAINGERSDGYRHNSDSKQFKTFSKFGTTLGGGHFTAGLETYVNKFHLPGYIDLGSSQSGSLSDKAAVNSSDHGLVGAYTLTLNYARGNQHQALEASAYASNNSLERYTTTTPFPQFFRSDHRWTTGGNVDQHWRLQLFNKLETLVQIGATLQDSSVNINEYPSEDGSVIAVDASNSYDYHRSEFNQLNSAVYGAVTVKPVRRLKLSAGLRYDRFSYLDVTDRTFDTTSGAFVASNFSAGTGHVSPKFGVAYQLLPTLTVFANYAESPNSPSAVTQLPSNHNLGSSYLRNDELGFSFDSLDGRYHLQAIGYQTLNQNEIGEVGYQVVNFGKSHRNGYDFEGALGIFHNRTTTGKFTANFTRVSATLSGGGYVPYLSNWLSSYGFQLQHATHGSKLNWNVNHDFYGPQKLDSDAAYLSKTYSRLSSKLSYDLPRAGGVSLWAGGVFYPGDRYSEFAFDLYNRVYTNPEPLGQVKFGLTIPLTRGHEAKN